MPPPKETNKLQKIDCKQIEIHEMTDKEFIILLLKSSVDYRAIWIEHWIKFEE